MTIEQYRVTVLAWEAPVIFGGKRGSTSAPNAFMVWKFSKNVPAAKEFLVYLMDNDKEGMVESTGYNMPFLNDMAKKPMPVIGTDGSLVPSAQIGNSSIWS